MFSSFSCSFTTVTYVTFMIFLLLKNAKFKDKFIFNGGSIDKQSSITIISEAEAIYHNEECVIDWWILDSIRLKRVLPFEWYRPIIENPFLASFRFHFFQLEEDESDFEYQQNTLVDESNSLPIDLIKSLLKRFGASIADSIDPQTTHVITQFQCEHLLPTQLLGPVHFVTLPWLLKVLSATKYSDPCDAIDFPCPIHPIPESSSLNVCLSGFNATERKLLTAQLSLMGIVTSPDFSPSISHLICSQFSGKKFEMARIWNIKIVDKNWIDNCYKKWKIL